MMEFNIPKTWSSWSIGRFICEVIKDRKTFIHWLISRKLIPENMYCHGEKMRLVFKKLSYRCDKGKHNHPNGKSREVSLMKGTIFESSNYPEKIMMICLLFANDYSFKEALKEMSFSGKNVSESTIGRCYNLCRQLISRWMIENQADEKEKLGGRDRTVVIEVHQFERSKILCSDIFTSEENWVIGILERETSRYRLQTFQGEKPNDETLYMFTVTYVLPQTIIICDSESEAVKNTFENCEHYCIYEIEDETIPPECRTMLQAIETS